MNVRNMHFIFWFNFVVVLSTGTEASSNAITEDFVSRGKLRFYLYKRDNINKSYELRAGSATNMEHFNPDIPTYVFSHGYAGSSTNVLPQTAKNAFLKRGEANMILPDFSSISTPYLFLYAYYEAIGIGTANLINYMQPFLKRGEANVILPDFSLISTPYLFLYAIYEAIGIGTANLINYMQRYGLKIQDCTFIGHSAGAHIVGVAARHLDDELPVLYGLDAARPLFEFTPSNKRLDKDCASSVIVFYTSSDLGMDRPIGNINFFINNGKNQPSCVNSPPGCSHVFAVLLFASAVEFPRKFIASKCETAIQAKNNFPCEQTSGILLFSNVKERPPKGIYNVKTS